MLGTLEPVELTPLHLAAGDEYVYATLDHSYKVRKNGKMLVLRNGVHRFKLRDGRVVAWFAADDTKLTNEMLA